MKTQLALSVAASLLLACGADDKDTKVPDQFVTPAYACTGQSMPGAKFIPHQGGVPDEYIVVLMPSVQNVRAAANALQAEYGGEIMNVYDAVLGGFSIRIGAAAAEDMSAEPEVCWVEQNGYVSGDV